MASQLAVLPRGIVVLERGWLSSNNVVLAGKDSAAVVDTGYWTHSDQTVSLVSAAIGSLPLVTIANTHLHSDHCGGNAALQGCFPGAKTLVPPGQAAAVRAWDAEALSYEPTGQHCPPFRVDAVLEPGREVALGARRWQVHAAPGHDPNSVVLFEPDSRTLISADALWENGFGVVFPELEGIRAFNEVADTLDLIESLEPATVIPGHGRPFADIRVALERARSRLDAYVASPAKHAVHAAKVLLKFKLLELQRVREADFVGWAENTHYFQLAHARWAPEVSARTWIQGLLAQLLVAKAMRRAGAYLMNA